MDIRLPLPAALRHRVESEEYLWAYFTSHLLSPPVVWAIWVFAIAWPSRADNPADLQFAMLFAVAVCAAPILFVSLMVRSGRIGDLHMRESRERYIPYTIAIIGALCCLFTFPRFGADPSSSLVLTLVTIVELAVMLFGNALHTHQFPRCRHGQHHLGDGADVWLEAGFGVSAGALACCAGAAGAAASHRDANHARRLDRRVDAPGGCRRLGLVHLARLHTRQTRAVPSQDQDRNRVASPFQAAPLTRLRCRKRRGISSPSQR